MKKNKLTTKQRNILSFLIDYLRGNGYPPTLREIADFFRLTHPKNARDHLDALERKGYIKRVPGNSRAIEILGISPITQVATVPIVGKVRAGEPITAIENIEGNVALDRSIVRWDDAFLVKIEGESMIEAHIQEGDLALVRPQREADNGDIVVALLGDEVTVKRFYKEDEQIRLEPANSSMEPIIISKDQNDIAIIGKVMAIVRDLGRV